MSMKPSLCQCSPYKILPAKDKRNILPAKDKHNTLIVKVEVNYKKKVQIHISAFKSELLIKLFIST